MIYGYARVSPDGQSVNAQAKQLRGVGAGFRSLADAWADATTPHGRLMLTALGGLAEFEREFIRAGDGDGRRRRAKVPGVQMGDPPKLTRHQRERRWRRFPKAARRKPISRGMFCGARFRDFRHD